MTRKHSLIFVAAAVTYGSVLAVSADVYTYRTIVMTGDSAIGSFNGDFTEFGVPSINQDGLVAFAAKTNAASVTSGLWMTPANAPNTIGFVAGKGWPAPGTPGGVSFGDFSMSANLVPLINDLGNVGFTAPLLGIGNEQVHGLFRRIDGTVTKVAVPGDPAPGIGGGVVLKTLDWPAFNNNNLMAFLAVLDGPGVTSDNDVAQYMHWFGGLNLVQREGWTVPGLPGTTFGQIFSWRSQINDAGRVLFQCSLNNGGSSTSSHWTGWPGALSLLAKSGDPAPGGMTWGAAQTFSGGSLSQNGTCFARAVSDGNGSHGGLWYHNGQSTQAIGYKSGPGPLGTYNSVFAESAMSNGNGTVAFRARFNQASHVDTAILRKSPGQPTTVVVRENDSVYPWGTIQFDDFGSNDKVMIDDNGRTYIIAKVRGPDVNADNDMGMWVREADGEWHYVIRRGQYMALEDGVFRVVDTFAVLPGYGLHTGYRPGINNRGDIAMRINFTDGTSAIVVAELPACIGDLNNDDMVNVFDLLMLLESWGVCNNCPADLNDDGSVNVFDLLALLENWGACS